MPRRSASKCSVASRTLRAAAREDQEARLQLAADELDNGQHDSLRKAAAAHNIPEATLCQRRKGRHTKKDAHADQQALPPVAETTLVECIWPCAYSGFPLTPALIWEYANDAIHAVPGCLDPVNVGTSWLQVFLVRHPSIRSHWSRCLDNTRLMGATEEVVHHWFVRLGEVMRDFHVASTNVFNMDETGFMFGQGASKRVVVPSSDPASRFRAQPGTQELATIIECIGSGGQVLPPLIITKGKRHTVGEQRQMQGIPATWCFSKSDTGWTNNELAVEWLENVFEPNTRLLSPSEWRLLIIDGHRSHTSEVFCDVLWSHRIIPYLLPAHTTHIMQPLNVSNFGPLMAAYCHIVNTAAEHVDAIDKAQFGTFYAQAWEKVLTQSAAWKAFSDSGISLDPSPEKVLRRLPGRSTPAEASRTPLQELAVPRSTLAFNATLDTTLNAHTQEPGSREVQTLKRTLQQTNAAAQASIVVLEAEVNILQAQHERKRKMAAMVGWKVATGDQRVLSKDVMITQEFAERELVAKGQSRSRRMQGNRQEEEEEVVASPPAAAPDGDDASEDDDEGGLTLLTTLPPPPMQPFLDDLDGKQPLDTIDEVDPGGFGFFDTLPQAGPSRTKH